MNIHFLQRSTLLGLLALACAATAWGASGVPAVKTDALSPYDKNAPVGFGASTTGSADENPVTVKTLDELKAAFKGTDKRTIYIDGTIQFTGSVSFKDVKNKTVYGLPGSALANTTLDTSDKTKSGIMTLSGCDNIILRNLTFLGAGAYDYDGYDNLTISTCTNIWIDHCDFQDGTDGNLDCNNGSDAICVSWCRFRYLKAATAGGSGGSSDHRFSNLWGNGDENADKDEGKLRTTFYACWWDNGCKQRMPRVRFGQVHILNCLYASNAADVCIGAGYRCNVYAENNVFSLSKGKAWQNYATSTGYTDYNIQLTGNQGAADEVKKSGSITQFVPSYTYDKMAAADVEAAVKASNGAGATLQYGYAFADFSAIVNNQTGTLLTAEEQVQGTAVNFGIAVAANGSVSRVAADDFTSIATISGTYHSEHGLTGMKVVVPVPGKCIIQIGTCTYSNGKITVTNSNGDKVIEYTPQGEQGTGDRVCWKNDRNNIIELQYKGDATTLTITGMSYCPFVAVKAVKSTVVKSIFATDFSDWSVAGASKSVSTVSRSTKFSEETLTFSLYNTAVYSTSDTKFSAYTELPHMSLQAAKAADPYIVTSPLANITKVRYIHGATGSNRGWKLEAKGDGDADWVVISDAYASPAAWSEVTKDVNRTNCQLRFTNLNSSQNAYLFELEIFGEVALKMYEVTGTISGGNIDGSDIMLTGNGETYTAKVADGTFTMSLPAGTYTPSLSGDVAYLLKSPETIVVSADGSIGTITIEAATAQTVSGAIANAPAEAFTLTFTGANNVETASLAAGATAYEVSLMPDTYTISSNIGTLSPLSTQSFKVVKDAVSHNIYFPEAAVPAATQQQITVDQTATVAPNIYNKVGDALAAAKAGNISAPVITLASGQTFREQLVVDMADVTLKTSGTEKAKITFYYGIGYSYYSLNASGLYDRDRAMTRNSMLKVNPVRWGATVLVKSSGKGFRAENIIFENSFNQYYTTEEVADGVVPNGIESITVDRQKQSVAADSKTATERAAALAFENNPTGCQLYDCTLIGSQDTYYTSGTIYNKHCDIQGNTDYIFGGGYVVFDECTLTIGGYSDKETSAYITAYKDGSTLSADKRYVFRDCTVRKGSRKYVAANLGRDWGGSAASVYFLNLKNQDLGDKLSYAWNSMSKEGGVSDGTADLHIYDFDATVNKNYQSTGTKGSNINGTLTADQAKAAYTEVVQKLGFTPERVYDITLDEQSAYNAIRIAAANGGTGSVSLARSIKAGNWSTICLPFALSAEQVKETFGDDVKLAEMQSYEADTKQLTMAAATAIEANKPYMIRVSGDVSGTTAISGVTYADSSDPSQTVGGITMQGVYQSGTIAAGDYFVADNQLYRSQGQSAILPFRAYFTGVPSGARLLFLDDMETTGIEKIYDLPIYDLPIVDSPIYNLSGQRISQPRKGIVIVGGRKVVK